MPWTFAARSATVNRPGRSSGPGPRTGPRASAGGSGRFHRLGSRRLGRQPELVEDAVMEEADIDAVEHADQPDGDLAEVVQYPAGSQSSRQLGGGLAMVRRVRLGLLSLPSRTSSVTVSIADTVMPRSLPVASGVDAGSHVAQGHRPGTATRAGR